MQIWRNYDTDSSGYISAIELKVTVQIWESIWKTDTAFGGGEMISDPQKSSFCLLCQPRLDRYWRLIKMKKHICWVSLWQTHLPCVFLQGFLQDLFLQHGKTITPKKLEEYTDTMVTAVRLGLGGATSLAHLHSDMFFFPSRWKCLTKTKMADWISMTWPGTVRIVSSIAVWHLRVFLHLFAATPAVLFHGGDTGEGVTMRDTLNDKNCISSTEGASTFWGGWPLPPLVAPLSLYWSLSLFWSISLSVFFCFWVSLWCFSILFLFSIVLL